jgi:nicotinamidase-related amidase
VITKHRYSAFVGTNLDLTLRTMGVRSLLFTGVATEVCTVRAVSKSFGTVTTAGELTKY